MNERGYLERLNKVQNLIAEKQLQGIVLRRNPNLAWMIGGRVHVPSTLDSACFDLIITADEVTAVTNTIEAPRLVAEELPSNVSVKIINWWEGRDKFLPSGENFGCDQPGANRFDLSREIEILRQSLVSEDIERFRSVCSDSSIALGEALKNSHSNDREIDLAGKISKALWEKNLELVFIGVAGQTRVQKHRHPLPTDSVVGNRIVASICARRKGLISSVTRIVSFNDDDISGYENILKVESEIFEKTKVGAKFSEPIEAAVHAYEKFQFDKDEWMKHHQGGPTGYAPRDWAANRESDQLILPYQPIAWNPTGNGWKVEDTIMTKGEINSGFEILTLDPNWPSVEVNGRPRPGVLKI